MFADAQGEIENMEKERMRIQAEEIEAQKVLNSDPNNTALQQSLADKKKAHLDMMMDYNTRHRDLSEIREAMGELLHGRKPKIRI